jgi:hypothetical protein
MDSATLFQRCCQGLLPLQPAYPLRMFSKHQTNGLERSCTMYADGIDLILKYRKFWNACWRSNSKNGHTAWSIEQERDGVPIHDMQVRGSIPIFWDQVVDLKWKPKIRTVETGPSVSLSLCTSSVASKTRAVVVELETKLYRGSSVLEVCCWLVLGGMPFYLGSCGGVRQTQFCMLLLVCRLNLYLI